MPYSTVTPCSATRDHIEVDDLNPCWHCRVLTYFIELGFETRLHPGECSFAKWDELHRAFLAVGPISPLGSFLP